MQRNINQLYYVLSTGFILIALSLIYWQIIKAQTLLTRNDNPRLIIAEQQIRRGTIFSREGKVLVKTIINDNDFSQRHYLYPSLAHVTGYYSVRYDSSGLESVFSEILVGHGKQTYIESLLHRPQFGEHITTTIQLSAQLVADEVLAKANTNGAIIVLDTDTGNILVMSSRPTFNPNIVDTKWDSLIHDTNAPLLNRATQGIFPLGKMAKLVGLISLLENNNPLPTDPLDIQLSLDKMDWITVVQQLHFDRELTFTLPTEKGRIPTNLPDKAQEISTTPLHVALMAGAWRQHGIIPIPTLIQTNDIISSSKMRLMNTATADFMNSTITDVSIFVPPEITGNESISWYIGLPKNHPSIIIIVVVNTFFNNSSLAKDIGQKVLQAISF